ncbi:hypothetical protein [Sediminibacillus massiliensis]|uniref:hypothetical protein n=1 Tax=Sediminibacillus massiliensis TaxID=1926277 RepID=UPI0015C2CAA5|nr:hypothetical protein [Sediminibacillus massiliensis]
MRYHQKQSDSHAQKSIFGVNYHKFMEAEGELNRIELAGELGVTLGDIKKLKERLNRA